MSIDLIRISYCYGICKRMQTRGSILLRPKESW